VKGFKDGVKDGGASADAAAPPQQVTAAQKAADANTVDVEAKTKS
jgi:sec-independent protein translocase protein TatA